MKKYKIEANAIDTLYNANSEQEALETYAKDAGYKSYADLVEQHGEVDSIEEINQSYQTPAFGQGDGIMVYAIYTPSNCASTAPSICYSYRGEMTGDQLEQLDRELSGSLCSVRAFDSEEAFREAMIEMDNEFYEHRG